jgi:uncharacterized membrane protein
MDSTERYIARWQSAGLLPAETAEAIRAYELAHAKPGSRQWQVLLALILGAILLGAGVLLFVAAHWDSVGPTARLCLVLSMLVFFHGIGLLTRERFDGFATAMHAVGTISAGAAIALVGQIFNMQEHWPAAVLLWALCAAAGWWLLRDAFQQTLSLLLVPAWIVCEWHERTHLFSGSEVYLARICLVIGTVYLTAFLHERKRAVFGILFAAGTLITAIGISTLSSGWLSYFNSGRGFIPLHDRVLAFVIIGGTIAAGASKRIQNIIPAAVAVFVGFALPWLRTKMTHDQFGQHWTNSEPSLLAYAMVGGFFIFLTAWGVRNMSRALVNAAIAGFAITVAWFYFSSIMDKLNRSLGLIVLGIVFLAGGWLLEVTRRRLVSGMARGEA